MKKIFIILATTSMVLTACSNAHEEKYATTEEIAAMQAEIAKMKNPPPDLSKNSGNGNNNSAVTVSKVQLADVSKIPDDELGKAIKDGLDIVQHTYKRLPQNVGNRLNCTSCHLGNGSTAYASPWNGVPGLFPQYRARSGKVSTIEDRINGCFSRSMNGRPIAADSVEMKNIVAYMMWLSKGIPTGQVPEGRGFVKINQDLTPNRDHGKALFAQKCSSCHGADGNGQYNADGTYSFPAIAGKDSFNDGAGMARTYTAAAFIKGNMPFGQPNSLSEQEAVDIADYFTHLDRPIQPNKDKDWPKGGAPKDARR